MEKPIVSMRNIVKRFPGVVANDHIDLDVFKGEVLALLGENGAGKTTLMNILYGLYRADEGEIYIDGKKVYFKSPKDAITHGIGMVHQQFMLIDELSVVENIILGLKEYGLVLDLKEAVKKINKLAREMGFKIDPWQKVWQLSAGEKQRVEILKAIFRNVKVLILDEPTSVLTPQETRELFKIIKKLIANNIAVIFISHKLHEVMEIADKIVVLRKGKVVGKLSREQATPQLLAKLMVGREVFLEITKRPKKPGHVVLEVKNLKALSDKGVLALKGISFRVRAGEIVGIAGVAGNGQKELAEVIYGLRKPLEGKIYLFGKDVTHKDIYERIRIGISLIPENRLGLGIVGEFSVAENLILERIDEQPFSLNIPLLSRLNIKKINEQMLLKYSRELIEKFSIVTPSPFAKARTLSGGNIQRLILARELGRKPGFIIAEEPTAGLDVSATEYVRKLLLEMREQGYSILLISGDLSEVLSLSDKVMVMYEGEIVGAFRPEKVSLDDVGLMMTGMKRMPKEVIKKIWD